MKPTIDPIYYFPYKIGRIVLKATEEILGQDGICTVLNLAKLPHLIDNVVFDGAPEEGLDSMLSFQDLGKMQITLEEAYGLRSGRGLALRSGRACFKYGLQEYGSLLGLNRPDFRLLPVDEKLRAGLGLFAEVSNKYSAQSMRVEEEEYRFLWHIDRCPVCWGRRSETPVCNLAVGVLQELLYWISSGKHFHVEEILCIAKGDATCTFTVDGVVCDGASD